MTKCPLIMRSLVERENFLVEDKDLIRSSGAPTESGSGRFPEQVGARFV